MIYASLGAPVPPYYAKDNHQQYLAKNPGGYCNHGFCQVALTPDGVSEGSEHK